MNSLQIGLAIVGGLVLAAVVAHGAWTARKNAPRQPQQPAASQTPELEPTFSDTRPDAGGHSESQGESGAGSRSDSAGMLLPTPISVRKPTMDSLIDVIASLTLDSHTSSVAGETAIGAMPATRRVGSKPFAVEGLNVNTRIWENPLPGQRYSAFQAGVQLANRSGALNEIEYSEFVVKTQAFADAISATPEFPEMRDEVARARELDVFAGAHDAQLSFTIRARNASWSPGFIQQHAAQCGFVAGVLPGRMVLSASTEGVPPVLVLGFDSQAALAEDPAQSAIREVSLHLDVAQVERSEQPFVRMRDIAFTLAHGMEGSVTDDHGQPLEAQAMEMIGAELEKLYATLEQRDLPAGSALARRLFS